MADSMSPPPLFDDEQEEIAPQNGVDTNIGETTEINLNEEQTEEVKKEEKPEPQEPEEIFSPEPPSSSVPASVDVSDMFASSEPEKSSPPPEKKIESHPKVEEDCPDEEEEEDDQFDLQITVAEPVKVGDGMNAFMQYKVTTKTSIPAFRSPETSVNRRFSDFLGLHERLEAKHLLFGRIVPPPPEKSVLGMGKVKLSKEESGSNEFVEKRCAALERYLNRVANHPSLRTDEDLRQFLEVDDLPRATSTSALSGGGLKRFAKSLGDTVFNLTTKIAESDQWFEEKQQQIDNLEQQLRKLHQSLDTLIYHRKDLANGTGLFAKSTAMLSNAEEHTGLSRALSQLAEVEEKIEQLHSNQANTDFYVFSELVKEYLGLIQAVKSCFHQRMRCFSAWQHAQQTLTKKREGLVKLELAQKSDKIPLATEEVKEWEQKVEKGQEEFEEISKAIKKEMIRFEKTRVKDFKEAILKYLDSLLEHQQQVIKYWEGFLPEAKAIA